MKKSTKTVLILSGIIMAILLLVIGIISYFEKLQPEEITYPGSGLSGSIFDTQNSSYTPNSSLTTFYKYKSIPYLLDVPEVAYANVEHGITFKLSNGLLIYTSEFPYNTDVDYTLSKQLGKVLMLDCNEDMTILETMKEEVGYRNGFGIVYDVKNMYVSSGDHSIKAVVMTYYIELPDEDEDVLIGVISLAETNDIIRNMKDILDVELATFRYDEDREREIENEQNNEARIAANEEAAAKRQEQQEASALAKEQAAEEKALSKLLTTSDVAVDIEQFYSNLVLTVSWADRNAVQSILLISPDGISYEPATLAEQKAIFHVPGANIGQWTARITGISVGTVNVTMVDTGGVTENDTTYYDSTTTTTTETTTSTGNSGSTEIIMD